jgi:uncharacterized protein (TIGR02145 family)/uncharacterized repeat protein (TIGR02543 family)
VALQTISYGGTATAPAAPTQTGFLFAGWYSDQALTIQYNFATVVTASAILYAKWTPVYTVTYNANNSTNGTVPLDANKYTNGVTVSVLDNTGNLARTGYTFAGWNTNAGGTGADRIPGNTFAMGSVNVILYAKWTVNQVSVTFNSNGGSTVASQSVNYGSTATAPTAPTKTSYVFAGWYSDSLLTNAYSFSTAVTATVKLFAKWQIQDADGNVYTEVTIGTQVWMVQNLKTTKYNDETNIPIMTPDSVFWTPGYCWYDDSISHKNSFGALYNGYAVATGKLAPNGWHIPTNAELLALSTYLGGDSASGGVLKETGTAHWNSPNYGATNSVGFSAMPGGQRRYYAPFYDLGSWGYYWSSTQYGATVDQLYDFYLRYDNAHFIDEVEASNSGLSVRCIRNP